MQQGAVPVSGAGAFSRKLIANDETRVTRQESVASRASTGRETADHR